MKIKFPNFIVRFARHLSIIAMMLSFFLINACSKDETSVTQNPMADEEIEILVGSRNNSSVKKYDGKNGAFIGDLIATGYGGLNTTQDLLLLSDSLLLVTGLNNPDILMYNANSGEHLGNFSSGYALQKPTKMTLGPDNLIYVSQWGSTQNKIVRFNISGAFVDEFTSVNIVQALDHVFDQQGNLYVASFGGGSNGRVIKFDNSGNLSSVLINPGNISGPSNIWFNAANELLVADWTLGKVQIFSADGLFDSTFISGMQNIEGYAIDQDGNILLCDWTLNHVNKYDSSGNFISTFISDGNLSGPNSMLVRVKTR